MKRIGKKKGIFIVFLCVIVLWVAMGVVDYVRVSNFKRPVFCLLDAESGYDDGGSGTYRGLGYSFDIMGHFMPEDAQPGVTEYTCYLFGNEVSTGKSLVNCS